jgi:hypothetical protein
MPRINSKSAVGTKRTAAGEAAVQEKGGYSGSAITLLLAGVPKN